MPEPARIFAVITGERGQREIVRPLAAIGEPPDTLDWDHFRGTGKWAHLRWLRDLDRRVRAARPATLFTDMNSAFLGAIIVVAKLHGARVVLRLRGDPFTEARDQLRFHWQQREWLPLGRTLIARLLDPILFAWVDRFIPVSHWIVLRLGIESRSDVVRVPIPTGSFVPRSHADSPPLRILAVTNFNFPKKIAALGRFLDQYGDFLRANGIAITVAGAGIAWENFSARHGLNATFAGFVNDVASLYAQHDLFVHFSDLDAFPYVVLEAQAAGLPTIVNNDCGMLEQIEHGETGLIVDLNDRSQVEGTILDLARSPERRAQLGAAGRLAVAARYSHRQIGEELRRALGGV